MLFLFFLKKSFGSYCHKFFSVVNFFVSFTWKLMVVWLIDSYFLLVSAPIVAIKTFAWVYWPIISHILCHFSLATFYIVFVVLHFTIWCLDVRFFFFFFYFNFLLIHYDSWIWKFMSFIILRKFSSIIFLNISSLCKSNIIKLFILLSVSFKYHFNIFYI